MVTGVPLSAENIALVRQHVPESVLKQLGDWTNQIPLIEPVNYNEALTQIPTDLRNKLFFTNGFRNIFYLRSYHSDTLTITQGVALVFFKFFEFARADGVIQRNWTLHVCGFENGNPFGEYYLRRKGGRIVSQLYTDKRTRWESTVLCEGSQGWEQSTPHNILYRRIPKLLAMARQVGAQDFPRAALAAPIRPETPPAPPERPIALFQPVEQPVDRAWYLRIVDAVSHLFNSFLICLSDLLRGISARIERVIVRG